MSPRSRSPGPRPAPAARDCACEVCRETLGPGDAVSPEGYCGFCARHCFPLNSSGTARVALTVDIRQMVHAGQPAPPPPVGPGAHHDPLVAVGQQLAPLVEAEARRLVASLWRRFARRR